MVAYVGGKAGSGGHGGPAKDIAKLILSLRGDRQTYIEPFLGGASVWEQIAPNFDTAIAGDAALDLMLMWRALRDGWVPPLTLSEGEYRSLKTELPSALRGLAGFGASWGGKWFGGYARGYTPTGTYRDFWAEKRARAIRIANSTMQSRELRHCSYRDWDDIWFPNTVVYADPPYKGTLGYPLAELYAGKFNHDDFWHSANWWVDEGALVFVSEYEAPEGWTPILTVDHYKSIGSSIAGADRVQEKLWCRNG